MENKTKRKYTVSAKVRRKNKLAAQKRIRDGKNVSPFTQDRSFASAAGKKGAGVRWNKKPIENSIDN